MPSQNLCTPQVGDTTVKANVVAYKNLISHIKPLKSSKSAIIISVNDKQVVKFASGENHNVFLTDDGRVYTSGLNIFGQLGNGEEEDEKSEFAYYPLKGIDRDKNKYVV